MPVLNEAQLNQMNEDGFVVLSNYFDHSEICQLEQDLLNFHTKHEEMLRASGGESGISRAGEILFSDHIAEQNEAVLAFTKHQKMVDLTTQLLGPDIDLYWNQTVYKNPENEKEFPWHQDDAYTPVAPSPYLTCWLAVSDATEENGCISVLPGSHKQGLIPHEQTKLGLVGYSSEAPDQGIKVPIPKGSLIAFWSTTLHKSGPNLSTGMRKAYVIQYATTGLRRKADGLLIPNLLPIARGNAPV
jgi:phytanoyl-CoA hydroxylase